MARARGFTLVELMLTVTMIAVISAVAVVSWRKSHTQDDVDRLAAAVRNAVTQAARRASATGRPYMLDVRPRSIQWCEAVAAAATQCPCVASPCENGPIVGAPDDAMIGFVASAVDVSQPGSPFAAPARVAVSTPVPFYFGPTGTADASYGNVLAAGRATQGFTVYVRRQGNDEPDKRRRVVVYGVSARPRVIDNYN
jgi:prepilin-type N-terminal cleavage/methylation domain-containing protein